LAVTTSKPDRWKKYKKRTEEKDKKRTTIEICEVEEKEKQPGHHPKRHEERINEEPIKQGQDLLV
jgi:hypothetical protein